MDLFTIIGHWSGKRRRKKRHYLQEAMLDIKKNRDLKRIELSGKRERKETDIEDIKHKCDSSGGK